jgi:hypothetical protein
VFGGRASAEEPAPEHWSPVQRLIGSWAGTASGEPGEGTVQRRSAFIMNGRFIHEANTSTYPPQEKNKAGEVHQHWGVFSFDKARKTLMLRQFHVESFVSGYRRIEATTDSSTALVFESESFENFNNSWKARESYEFFSDDEFIEAFESRAAGQAVPDLQPQSLPSGAAMTPDPMPAP